MEELTVGELVGVLQQFHPDCRVKIVRNTVSVVGQNNDALHILIPGGEVPVYIVLPQGN